MKITLETVREVLREALGFDSFLAGFITSVEEDERITTAAIYPNGHLKVSQEFVSKFIKTQEDLFCLLMHELMHPLFLHYFYGGGMLVNIACDAIINAVINRYWYEASGNGSLFRKLYKPRGIEVILRPSPLREDNRYKRIFQNLYNPRVSETQRLTTGELIQTLKILAETEYLEEIILIGSHEGPAGGPKANADEHTQDYGEFPRDILEKIARNLRSGLEAGEGDALSDIFLQVLKTHLSIRKRLLKDYLTKRRVDRFFNSGQKPHRITSPVPICPSRRDLLLLASNIYPGCFHNRRTKPTMSQEGLVVFLDVSGSVNDYLPKILGVLRQHQGQIKNLYLFSNRVVEILLDELVEKGCVSTTYGTDFDCVAQTVLDKRFKKAVVITDGYADLKEENAKALKKENVRLLTLIFGEGEDCEPLEPFGPVVMLDDVTE